MAVEAAVVGAVQRRIAALWPHLNERQRRLLLGAEARELGALRVMQKEGKVLSDHTKSY